MNETLEQVQAERDRLKSMLFRLCQHDCFQKGGDIDSPGDGCEDVKVWFDATWLSGYQPPKERCVR